MKRILTPAERRELGFIERLQSMNIYPLLVKKLTESESAGSVARWAMQQKVEGAPGTWCFSHWEQHILALRRQVNESKEKMRREMHRVRKPLPPRPLEPEAVLDKVNKTVEEKSSLEFIQPEALKVMQHVMAAEKHIKAEHVLQWEAVKQINRIEDMTALEKRMGLTLPDGHKEFNALTTIAGQMARLELGHEMIRGRRGYVPLVPEQAEMSPFAKRLMEFDEVDRSLMRELSVSFVEMVKGERSGRFEAAGLEADATGEIREMAGEESGNLEPPFTERS
nr:hypothetical protein Hi04_10k_c4039_00006 [uncultured bacterium]